MTPQTRWYGIPLELVAEENRGAISTAETSPFDALAARPNRERVIGRSAFDDIEPRDPRHPPQFVLTTIDELDTGSRHEVSDRARDQHFSRTGECSHPRTSVDRNPTNVVASGLDFTSVQANADIHSNPSGTITDCEAALNGSTRTVECGEEAVAHGLNRTATVCLDALVCHVIMAI